MDEGPPYNPQNGLKLEIVNSRGETRTIEVTSDLNVDKLKLMALSHFQHDPLASIKMIHSYKLVSILKKKTLIEDATLRDEDICDGDMILLLPRLTNPSPQPSEAIQKELRGRGPSEGEIIAATANLTPKNMDRKSIELGTSLDVSNACTRIDYHGKISFENSALSFSSQRSYGRY